MGKSTTDDIKLSPRLKDIAFALRVDAEIKDHHGVLQQIMELLPGAMQVERCSIFFQDTINKRAMLQCGTHLVERELSCPMEGTVVGEVLSTGKLRNVDPVNLASPVQSEVQRLTEFVTRSLLCVPVFSSNGKKVNGAIQLLNRTDGRPFDEVDAADMQQLAEHLGPAMATLVTDYERFMKTNQRGGAGKLVDFLSKWFPKWF